ncbi:hypothetical protein [Myroides odoratus]|uniref:Conjugal transfer protein TraD n=1 Tax=Myroides odoratus TaxID=256 RepID=A0A9Q7EA36_MYROD|nr:hypothetical protein [Myroides odoratus]EHQ44303.1 hypothetical protein Myrod_3505 [Myroides odoratus DSM 2801]EKB02594.1 hypothetical protein HMPREF9716_03762 [Myroides odoratus CIP 103059]EKB02999.1 hypothetical protein HMPREF9716_03611 [Myroides odoratus CIP 103059]QQU01578.1 hypothetical protein I6I88_07530 [Myroides odoratus]WQD56143.1 hypothetical protein U0010_11455 [Myroides odoratus]
MEIIIIISLVLVITLLLLDKNKTIKQENPTKTEELPFKQDVPVSIIGESKPVIIKQSLMSQTEVELDLEEEEKELSKNLQSIDHEFTERVSMEELNSFVRSIEKELINETTVKTAQKIEGSDLLELLQQAMPDSAKTIAKLLDQSLNEKSPKKEEVIDSEDFNINDFV